LENPRVAWQVNPDSIKTAADWRAFFRDDTSRTWFARVVSRVDCAPLEQLEKEGRLILYSKSEVENFQGMRMAGKREPVSGGHFAGSSGCYSPAGSPRNRRRTREFCREKEKEGRSWILCCKWKDKSAGIGV